jgi:hypothetical protein
MRASERKKTSGRPEVRSLKIQPKIRDNRRGSTTVPELKLCGHWLTQLGFAADKRVNITTMNKLLIIRIEE